jgi:hypothetical protein
MAHWAELNVDNLVIRVTVGDNNDPNGDEGYQWLIDNLGGTWLKTSYNTFAGVHQDGGTPLRKNFAGVGFTYDPVRDAFIAPKPDDFTDEDDNSFTFVLNEDTCQWEETPAP